MKIFKVQVKKIKYPLDAARYLITACPLCHWAIGISDMMRRGGESIICRGDHGSCGGHYYLRNNDELHLVGIVPGIIKPFELRQ